jgi:peptide/nickel transport system substrate-binding protein
MPAAADAPLRLTVGTLGSIGSLDPRTGTSQIAHEVWNLQYPTLTALDPKTLDPAPGLAQAWTPAPNGLGWIYTLRPGVQWSDGQPVTSADVVASVARADAGRARALSPRTVEVDGRSTPGLPVNVTPGHVLASVPDLDQNLRALGVADGPWHVTARTNDSVQLDATRPAGPALQQIVFRTYSDANALIRALHEGEVDVASGLTPADATRLGADSNVTIDHAPDGTQYQLQDNLPEANVRKAVSLAIDRTDLVAKTVDGIGTPGAVPIFGRGTTFNLDQSAVDRLDASLDAQPDQARRLLADNPHPDRVHLAAPADALSRSVARYVAAALAGVGLPTDIVGEHEAGDLKLSRASSSGTGLPVLSGRPLDYSDAVAAEHAEIEQVTRSARLVGLFQPDTLQAFRSDNVAGFLRSPQIPSLVVFAPTTTQYLQLIKAPPPPGEQASTTSYVVGAIGVVVLCGAALAAAAWIRRRFVA